MDATGDWWAPYYNDEPFFDKPVLFHQLQAVQWPAYVFLALAVLTKGPIALVLCGLTSLMAIAVVRRERLDGIETLLCVWTLVVVGFFTLSTFKPRRSRGSSW